MSEFLNSPLYRQMMAQVLQGGQITHTRNLGGGLGDLLGNLAEVYGTQKFADKMDARDTAKNQALAQALNPELNSNIQVTPQVTAPGDVAFNQSMGAYDQPAMQSPDLSTISSRLQSSGNADAISAFAPKLLDYQLGQAAQANAPISPAEKMRLTMEREQQKRQDAMRSPEYLGQVAGAEANARAAAPISAEQRAQLDQQKALLAQTAQFKDPKYLAQVAGATANAEVPAKIAVEQAKASALNQPFDPDTVHFMAEQALAGDKSVFAQLGFGPTGAANRTALRNEVTKLGMQRGMGGRDLAALNAEFTGLQAGERTLGNRTANIEMASNEAQQMVPLALAASNGVNRTQYPTLNSVLLAVEKGSGDENVVRLGIATNSLINIYARAISPTGVPTVSDKDHARELLSQAWSKGQFAAGLDQFGKELSAARQSPGAVRGEFRNAIGGAGGTGIAPIPGAPEQPQQPAPAPAAPKIRRFNPQTGRLE